MVHEIHELQHFDGQGKRQRQKQGGNNPDVEECADKTINQKDYDHITQIRPDEIIPDKKRNQHFNYKKYQCRECILGPKRKYTPHYLE